MTNAIPQLFPPKSEEGSFFRFPSFRRAAKPGRPDLAAFLWQCLRQAPPALLLGCAEIWGVPSGLHVACLAALCVQGGPSAGALLGCCLSPALRALLGLAPHPELVLPMLLLWAARRWLRHCGNALIMLLTALALLPSCLLAGFYGTAMELTHAIAALLIAAFSVPVLFRAQSALTSPYPLVSIDVRVACGYFFSLLCLGAASMSILGINLGLAAAGAATLMIALSAGAAPAIVAGFASGLMLSLHGLPGEIPLCLSLGGFFCAMTAGMGRKWLSCLAFASGETAMLFSASLPCMQLLPSLLFASALVLLAPESLLASPRKLIRRFMNTHASPAEAYASDALRTWEQAVAAMAEAVPLPRLDDTAHDGAWWKQQLCSGCPELSACGAMLSPAAVSSASAVWGRRRLDDEAWLQALDGLRGLGCARLYCLRAGMDDLRRQDQARNAWVRQASKQRAMLVTHLTALSGAARRYAQLAESESWWDTRAMRRLNQRISDTAFPASVLYARRVQGHPCAALEMHSLQDVNRLLSDALRLTSSVLETPMQLAQLDGNRIIMRAAPPFIALSGVCAHSAEPSATGDALWTGFLTDGRFVCVLSDGMGQGTRAGSESASTVRLLQLCLDAGYTRPQALTAVNGMMLLETGGERFATADLLTIELWTGQASFDKLGAAASWLLRGDTLSEITGDALPMGIMEQVESRQSLLRLRAGDRLAMVTDGIEDAFESRQALEKALRSALEEPRAQHAAELLLSSALQAAQAGRMDDMTVAVIQLEQAPKMS